MVKGQRRIIDELVYSEVGFNNDLPNGLVETNPVLIKTQNGVVELTKIRKGKVLLKKETFMNIGGFE